jgi:predicted DCC family thiol-disulfide oxidoreductase YuxK
MYPCYKCYIENKTLSGFLSPAHGVGEPSAKDEAKSAVVIFDGTCDLCNRSVQFIKKHDKKGRFSFLSNQSENVEGIAQQFDYKGDMSKSVVLLKDGKMLDKSTAVLHIMKQLSGAWPLLYVFSLVPKFIRDFFYGLFAKNRHWLAFR